MRNLLTQIVADRYPSEEDARTFAEAAELPLEKINFSRPKAIDDWDEVIKEAYRRGKLRPLLRALAADREDDEVMRAAIDAVYRNPQPPADMMPELVLLSMLTVKRHPDEETTREIATQAGLDATTFPVGGTALDRWDTILMRAVKEGALERLLVQLADKNKHDDAMVEAIKAVRDAPVLPPSRPKESQSGSADLEKRLDNSEEHSSGNKASTIQAVPQKKRWSTEIRLLLSLCGALSVLVVGIALWHRISPPIQPLTLVKKINVSFSLSRCTGCSVQQPLTTFEMTVRLVPLRGPSSCPVSNATLTLRTVSDQDGGVAPERKEPVRDNCSVSFQDIPTAYKDQKATIELTDTAYQFKMKKPSRFKDITLNSTEPVPTEVCKPETPPCFGSVGYPKACQCN